MSEDTTSEHTEPVWWRAELMASNAENGSNSLWDLGAGGVEVRDQETFFDDSPEFTPVPEGLVRLIAYFECESELAAHKLEQQLGLIPQTTIVDFARFDDRSWETKWHEFFKPRNLAPLTIVGPPWEEFDAPEGGRKIIIQPGMAFGTGTHETTQLVSTKLEELLGERTFPAMLDVGCGSGILSILAAQLGVNSVLGLEISEDPLENARENQELNALVDHDIVFSTTPLAEVEGTYPLVVANIIAPILIALSHDLIAHTNPGGTLVLSGILAEQMDQIRDAFSPYMTEVNTHALDPWHAIEYTKPEQDA